MKVVAVAVILMLAIHSVDASYRRHVGECNRLSFVSTPAGLDDIKVFMATGVIDDGDPDDLSNCAEAFCLDDAYFKTILKLDDTEIERRRKLAEAHFSTLLATSVTDLVAQGKLLVAPYTLDSRTPYRMYYAADQITPSKGWKVFDGGFIATILDPDGLDVTLLSGSARRPAGSIALFGSYYVPERTRHGKFRRKEIYFRATDFSIPTELVGVVCALHKDDQDFRGGEQGVAFITALYSPLDDKKKKLTIRNILSFSEQSPIRGLGPDSVEEICLRKKWF